MKSGRIESDSHALRSTVAYDDYFFPLLDSGVDLTLHICPERKHNDVYNWSMYG